MLSVVSACVCSLPARLPVALWTALLRDQPTPQRAFERRARAVRLSNVRRRSVETGGCAATRLMSLVCANVSAALMERLEDCILGDDAIYRAPVSLLWSAAARTARRARRGRPSPLFLYAPRRWHPFYWRSWDLRSAAPVHAPCVSPPWPCTRAVRRPSPAELWRCSRRGRSVRILVIKRFEAHAYAAAGPSSSLISRP